MSTNALKQIEFLVGEFSGPEKMHDTAWALGGPAFGRALGRVASLVLVQDQIQERDGQVSFSAVNVFTVDQATGEVVLYSFDSAGYLPDPPARGTWIGEELIFLRTTERGQSRTRYARRHSGYWWAKEFRQSEDAEWSPVVEGDMTAVAEA